MNVLFYGLQVSSPRYLRDIFEDSVGTELPPFPFRRNLCPPTGNPLLDHLADAKIHAVSTLAERTSMMQAFAKRLREEDNTLVSRCLSETRGQQRPEHSEFSRREKSPAKRTVLRHSHKESCWKVFD